MQSSVLYCEKANNYLNIKEKKSDIYFRIVLRVSQRSLWTEFTNMFFSLLPQSKGVFLQLARDRTTCGCGLPYCYCKFVIMPGDPDFSDDTESSTYGRKKARVSSKKTKYHYYAHRL